MKLNIWSFQLSPHTQQMIWMTESSPLMAGSSLEIHLSLSTKQTKMNSFYKIWSDFSIFFEKIIQIIDFLSFFCWNDVKNWNESFNGCNSAHPMLYLSSDELNCVSRVTCLLETHTNVACGYSASIRKRHLLRKMSFLLPYFCPIFNRLICG